MPAIDQIAEVGFDRILLATDFSPTADIPAAYAVALARRFSSTLELTNVIDLSPAVPSVDVLIGPALDALRQTGEENLQRMADGISGVKVTKKVIQGFLPASLVLEAAVESKSELVVLGTSSKQGLKKLILGSTAEEIIRNAVCPVLTVGPHVARPADVPLAFQSIIYATDLSPQAAKAANYALFFAEDSGAHLYLCQVIDDKDPSTPSILKASSDSLNKLIPESAYDWCRPECVTEQGSAAETILKLATRVDADLIVLGVRRSSFWLTYVDTGLTPAILSKARCPVLTVC
ncbi:universal stress protein [Tunturiibacter gelidiferens]|uniref:universal stress protein n=1 Tax=Tunturiibacter gelidiferens TaxID=3069689 RepID=UPI003D9B03DA